jgi:hypothetical protein
LYFAQSIQLSNIVLASLYIVIPSGASISQSGIDAQSRDLVFLTTRLGGYELFAAGFRFQPKDQVDCYSPEPIQPNVRRQATFMNRDTESVVALTPNVKLVVAF